MTHELEQRLSEMQKRADQTTETLDRLEDNLETIYRAAKAVGRLEDKADADDVAKLQDRVKRLKRITEGDSQAGTNLAEATDPENIHVMGDGIRVVDADALDRREEEPESIPLDEHLRNGGSHD